MPRTRGFEHCSKHTILGSLVTAAILIAAGPGFAQSPNQIDRLEQQVRDLQKQIQTLRDQITTNRQQVQKVQKDNEEAPKLSLGHGHPGWVSRDGQNSLLFTGRLHFDAGSYFKASGTKDSLQGGVNARRARIGVLGKVGGVWGYSLIGEFGGSTDATPSTLIEDAHISYYGLKPATIDLGYTDIPWTLGEATSSNNIMFIERSSAQGVATAFGAGDGRSTLGIHSNGDRWWGGLYLTGPSAGASHSGDSWGQNAVLGRLTYNPYEGPNNTTVHLGVNGSYMAHAAGHKLTLSDRPELRIDPTSFLSTGAMPTDSGNVIGVEAAATFGNFYADGEYFRYHVDRTSGFSGVNFDGGYAEASYTIGGHRSYSKGSGGYGGVTPDHPFDLSFTGSGAFELAARYSMVDLNDKDVVGGRQHTYSVGINWYPNSTIRFMLDYLHAEVSDKGAGNEKLDAIAMRTQFAF